MQTFHPSTLPTLLSALRNGAVLAFPTETTYGLGCDPRNRAALEKIYRIKDRPADKSLPLVADSIEQVEKYFLLSDTAKNLAEKHWPGPLSILLTPKAEFQKDFESIMRDGFVAVRASSHPLVRELTQAYGFPLTATSANLSGQPACLAATDVESIFENETPDRQPDLIVDGGELPPSEPSTLIKVGDDGGVTVLRQGAIKVS